MLSDPTTVSIAALAPRIDVCELCSVGPETLRVAVQVRHARGGAIVFAGCDRCAAAMRRVIAAAGGATSSGPAHMRFEASSVMAAEGDLPPGALTPGDLAPDSVGAPVLVHEYVELFIASEGQRYVVRAYGQERADGTWIGWLMFVSADDGQTIKRTARETTQSSREHLAYWASGLQQSYLDGAFSRAT